MVAFVKEVIAIVLSSLFHCTSSFFFFAFSIDVPPVFCALFYEKKKSQNYLFNTSEKIGLCIRSVRPAELIELLKFS